VRTQLFKSFERFLITLDSGVWGAVSRVMLGLAVPPVFPMLLGDHPSIWAYLALFLALLLGLRLGPAVVRLLLPFSPEAKEIWSERRFLAKRYDSYQWQKLFWIGLGMLPYVIVAWGARQGELVVAALALIAGGVGQVVWHNVRARAPR
jgi:hypothetical protein